MKSYTYSEARGNFATVLAEAEGDGAVEIRRRDGAVFRILPARGSKASPLDVKAVKLGVSTANLVAIVREWRERDRWESGARLENRETWGTRLLFHSHSIVPGGFEVMS